MTDEKSRETEDEQPQVEGHLQGRGPEAVRNRSEDMQDQEEPEVEGHMLMGPEKSMGPEKQSG